jgi:polyisoprenoid-binding protein YceI
VSLRRFLFAAVFAPSVALAQAPAVQSVASADPNLWTIDVTHSELTFEIRHFVSRVRGSFGKWKGTINADLNDWSKAAIDVAIEAATISTNNERRDADLRSSNFFSVDSFPTITFKSTKIERNGDAAKIYGDLTMRGVTKPVVLDGKFLGKMKQGSRERMGFEATTTVDRTQWGITWNRAAEGGGVMLGDEVKIDLVVAAIRSIPGAPAR